MKLSTAYLIPLLVFLSSAGLIIVNSVLAIYVHEQLRFSLQEVGVIVSALFLSSILVKIPTGLVARGSWLVVMVPLSFVLIFISTVGYYFASDFNMMLALRLVHGVGYAVSYIPLITMASLSVPKEKISSAIANFAGAGSLGLLVGPIFSTAFVSLLGVRESFLIAAILIGLGVSVSVVVVRGRPLVSADAPKTSISFQRIVSLAFSRRVLLPSICVFAFSYLYGVMISYAPLLGSSRFKIDASGITLVFFGYFAIATLFRFLVARLLKTYSARLLLAFGLLCSVIGLLLISVSWSLEVFALSFMIVGLGHSLIPTISTIVVARLTTGEERSLANSINQTYYDLGFLAGPLIGAGVVGILGISAVLGISALIPLASLVSALAIRMKSG